MRNINRQRSKTQYTNKNKQMPFALYNNSKQKQINDKNTEPKSKRKDKVFTQSRIQSDQYFLKKQNKKNDRSPEIIAKSPSKSNVNKSVQKMQNSRLYSPYQQNVKQFQKNKKNVYDEIQCMSNFKVTNPHSYFLNQKYPKAPIYQRAGQIIQKRQQILEIQRQKLHKQKEQQLQKEIQRIKALNSQRRPLKRQQAYELTNKLYKEHYSKLNRLNSYKIELQRQQSKLYREKPEINQTSKQIYHGLSKKHKIQGNIIDRFQYYEQQKAQNQKQIQDRINSKYYPFRPNISRSPSKNNIKDHSQFSQQKSQNKSSINLKIKIEPE